MSQPTDPPHREPHPTGWGWPPGAQPPYPAYGPPPTAPSTRWSVAVVLLSVAIAAVLLGGGGLVIYLILRDADARSAGSGALRPAGASAPVEAGPRRGPAYPAAVGVAAGGLR